MVSSSYVAVLVMLVAMVLSVQLLMVMRVEMRCNRVSFFVLTI